MGIIDRAKNLFAGNKKKIKNLSSIEVGYSNAVDPNLREWHVVSATPDEDTLPILDDIRGKSRNLFMNNELATAALKKSRAKTVGIGMLPKPNIDYNYIGITREKAKKIEKVIKGKFDAWASSFNSDASRMMTFYDMQALMSISWIMNGDAFAIPMRKKRTGINIDLCIQMIEADRVMSPISPNAYTKSGVEFDKNGELTAYYISDYSPYDYYTAINTVRRYPAFNSLGKRNILHVFQFDRIGQRRGVPVMAPILLSIKQLGRYKKSEVMAAVVNAMVGLIVETTDANDINNMKNFGVQNDNGQIDPGNMTSPPPRKNVIMENGTVVTGLPGETIKEFSPTRPNKSFKDFVDALYEEIGAALEMPKEVLLSNFQSSYSASKAALEEAHQRALISRKILERTFCQPIYEEFVLELIKNGDIDCPHFFEDESIRHAYTTCTWVGAGKSSLDPLKEANANLRGLEAFTTNRGIIAAESGLDFDKILEDRFEEEIAIAKMQKTINEIKGVRKNGAGNNENTVNTGSTEEVLGDK